MLGPPVVNLVLELDDLKLGLVSAVEYLNGPWIWGCIQVRERYANKLKKDGRSHHMENSSSWDISYYNFHPKSL